MCTPDTNAIRPSEIYTAKHAQLQSDYAKVENASSRVSTVRLLVFLSALIIAWFSLVNTNIRSEWLLVPLLLFIVLVWMHSRINERLQGILRKQEFYQSRLEHIAGKWENNGNTGDQYIDADHPYTSDLDIFGSGSLFEFLSSARTRLGKDTLAAWLTKFADPQTITLRQDAVRELSHRLDIREDLASIDLITSYELSHQDLQTWVNEDFLLRPWHRSTAIVLGVMALLSLVIWSLGYGYWALIIVIALEAPLYYSCHRHIRKMVTQAEPVSLTLDVLKQALVHIESYEFNSVLLNQLSDELRSSTSVPSVEMSRLYKLLLNLNQSVKNQFFMPFALLIGLPVHLAFKLDQWRNNNGGQISHWLNVVGQIEALVSLAQYGFENPEYTYPEISSSKSVPVFNAVSLSHPLIPVKTRVPNDVHLDSDQRLIIISGSNMSGKSTLLRSIGLGAVLAYCGAPVPAAHMNLSSFNIGCAMRASDSLQQGTSLFYAVISRIKRVVDLARQDTPMIFLLDEILQGTNSHDRLIGARGVIHQLLEFNTVGLVTTHDLALTHIADSLGTRAINIHFEDQFIDNRISFDYKIRPGVVQKSNALALMQMMGLAVDNTGHEDQP